MLSILRHACFKCFSFVHSIISMVSLFQNNDYLCLVPMLFLDGYYLKAIFLVHQFSSRALQGF